MRKRWFYSGDVNIEHGGMFYELSNFEGGWADVTRVTPCSDVGGPDNVFWVEKLTAIIDSGWGNALVMPGETVAEQQAHCALHDVRYPKRMIDALVCCGWDTRIEEYRALSLAKRRHVLVIAVVDYGFYDVGECIVVQIGKTQAEYSKREGLFTPDKILRAGTSLRNYVRANLSN